MSQNSCSPLLSSTGVFGGNHENNWWLVDSGASVTVLSEQTLKQSCYEILNEETVTNGPKILCRKRHGCGDEEKGDSKGICVFDGERAVGRVFNRANGSCG